MKEDVQAAEDALRSAGFARPSQMWGDVPKFQKEELESEMQTAERGLNRSRMR